MKHDFHGKKLYGTATVGSKGQLVIPADAREELGLMTGDRLYVIGMPAKKCVLLIKEEQMTQFIEQATDNVEEVKAKIAKLKQQKED